MIHTELIPNKGYLGLNPVDFGFETCKSEHSFGPAVRTYWLLHFVVRGHGIFERDGMTHHLQAGDLFVIPPFRKTFYKADTHDPWEYIWVSFTSCEDLPELLGQSVIHLPAAGRIFHEMKRCQQLENGKTAFICGKLWELFSLFWEQETPATDYVENALHLIHTEYMYDLSVETIAHRLGLDRSYFYSLFKTKTGVSPQQYLIRYRMEQAAVLMTAGGRSPTLAANSVGYKDIYTFSKMFKRVYGVSPREYIQTNR